MLSKDRKLVVVDPNYSAKYFRSMDEFRRNKRFTDVVLQINGEELVAHKAILSAASPFFSAMFDEAFMESSKETVQLLHETNVTIMTAILDYIYSGQLSIPIREASLLLRNFDYLQMDGVREECEKVLMKDINNQNCVELLILAEEISLERLSQASSDFLCDHFDQIYNVDDLKEVSLAQLEAIMKAVHKSFPDATYKAITAWLKYDQKNRSEHMHDLLSKYVKISKLSEDLTTHQLPKYLMNDAFLMSQSGGSQWLLENLGFKKQSFFILLGNMFYEFDIGNRSLGQLEKWPAALENFAAARYKDSVYVIGGQVDGQQITTGHCYDSKKKIWSSFECPIAKNRCGVCVDGQKLYMAGGWTDASCKSVSTYDFEAELYKDLPDMEFARWSPGVAHYNNSIYVLGGSEPIMVDDEEVSVIERYDPREGSWSHAGSIATDGISCSATAISDSIYIMNQDVGHIFDFDPRSMISAVMKEFPSSGTITSYDDQLYVVHESGISEYNIVEEKWSDIFMNTFPIPIIAA